MAEIFKSSVRERPQVPFAKSILRCCSWLWRKWSQLVSFVAKNAKTIVFLLMIMNAFGMVAPEKATVIRDAVLGLAL